MGALALEAELPLLVFDEDVFLGEGVFVRQSPPAIREDARHPRVPGQALPRHEHAVVSPRA